MRPAKRIKVDDSLSPNVIALIHDRIHEMNVIPGRQVFLTQRDWMKRDLLWLIENCGWMFVLIWAEEVDFIENVKASSAPSGQTWTLFSRAFKIMLVRASADSGDSESFFFLQEILYLHTWVPPISCSHS